MSRRPHRFPATAPSEVLGWKCAACGQWVNEFDPTETTECAVDWRNHPVTALKETPQ